uniref:Cytochrome P450 18a1 (inferred by orthology to a D. melanogaster protein) n=1 Tax=Strongyloides venezuelensis TaxID=75913 RepID=A0A0K0EZ49_STRVS
MIGILILIFVIFYLFNFYKKVKSLPPGPMPIPILGNLLSRDISDMNKIYLWIHEQKKIYGNVFTVWLPTPQVVFADYDSINEALITHGDHFIGRNVDGYPEKALHEKVNTGVIHSEGEEWRDQRRLSLQILRNFGMSKTIMQDKIHLVIQDFHEFLDNLEDKDNVDIEKVIQLSVGNIINLILFGFMYTHSNCEKMFEFVKELEASFKSFNTLEFRLVMLIPAIDKIPILKDIIYNRLMKKQQKVIELTKIQIDECVKSYNPEDEPPNFIHAVMKEIQLIDSKYSYLNSDHLEGMVQDFWIAGMETSATTLKWFILLVMKHLDIQKKLQNEIDETIGKDQLVQLTDKAKMPYMNAFINEGQRYINIVAFAPMHKCTKDSVINGHLIAKGTLTQPFYWGANMDEKYFKDPHVFNPDRFLDNEGRFKVANDHMSFGKGKRICAGKSLADAEIFLFITSLLQKYNFTHPNGPIDTTPVFSGVLVPKHYKCKIEMR